MIEKDLGIENGEHNSEVTALEGRCIEALQIRGTGESAAIPAKQLAEILMEETRDLRKLINHLIITHGLPVICKAGVGGGYFLPGDESEVKQFYREFHKRAMTGLLKASRGKRASFVDLMAQLTFGFDEPVSHEPIERLNFTPDGSSVPAFVQLVTKYLDRISADPQKYAAEIKSLQNTYGDIFVPREKVRMLKEKTAEFQSLLREIA